MAGYGVSNVAICARMRELGIPSISDKLRIGQTWSFYDRRRRAEVVFFLTHNDRVPASLWKRMSSEQHRQFPPHQWPDHHDIQS